MTNKRISGPERRAQIIDVALDIFAEKGFTGTRTKDIAKKAKISETLIFQHFKTKAKLYHEALIYLFSGHPVMPELADKIAQCDDFGVLSTLAGHMIHHSRRDPRIIRLAIWNGLEGLRLAEKHGHHKADDSHQSPEQALTNYIQERVRSGAFRSLDPELVTRLFIQTIMMFAADQELHLFGPPLPQSDDAAVKTLVSMFLDGMKA
jgi:AcrR family transcriptional regulator